LGNLGRYDTFFAVNKTQARLYDNNGNPINHNPTEMLRTQDLSPIYEENSNFYIFSKESFYSAGNRRIGIKPCMYIMSKLESVDIDEEDDFILAESIMATRRKNSND
jgi:CMP-N-acetylneuraminic acid synthetase